MLAYSLDSGSDIFQKHVEVFKARVFEALEEVIADLPTLLEGIVPAESLGRVISGAVATLKALPTSLTMGVLHLIAGWDRFARRAELRTLFEILGSEESVEATATKTARQSHGIGLYDTTTSALGAFLVDHVMRPNFPKAVARLAIDPVTFQRNLATLRDALVLLDRIDPRYLAAMSRTVDQITFTNIPGLRSASQYELLGGLYFQVLTPQEGRLNMVEKLLHESAHTNLFLLSTEDPLTLNAPEEAYPTVLRQDPRPVYGLFHAFYVATELLRVWPKIKPHLKTSAEAQTYGELQALYERVRDNTTATLKEHAKLTALGREVFEYCCAQKDQK